MRPAAYPIFLAGSLAVLALSVRPSTAEPMESSARAAKGTVAHVSETAGRGSAAPSSSQGSGVLAIVGGRIVTQSDAGVIEGTVLLEAGKIKAVAAEVDVPEAARRIDATGMTVTPGLIDARSTLRLTDGGRREGAADGSLSVLDAVDLYDEDWIEVVRHGVTAVYVQPASSGALGGGGAVVNLGPGLALDELVVKKDSAVQAAIGMAAAATNVLQRRQQFESIQKALKAAKDYGEAWEKYRAAQKKEKKEDQGAKDKKDKQQDAESGEKKTPESGDDEDKDAKDKKNDSKQAKKPTKPKREPAKEFLLRALKREIPARFEVHGPHAVRFALKLIDEFKLRAVVEGLTYQGALEEGLDRRRLPLVLGPMLGQVSSVRRTDDSKSWPLQLLSDETVWALGTYGSVGRDSRLLRAHAAAAVARGFEAEKVLAAMTSGAAEVLGVADRLGSLEVGKQADVSVFAGDPLDPSVPVLATVVRGKVVYENEQLKDEGAFAGVDPAQRPIESAPTRAAAELPAKLPARYALKSTRVLNESGTWQPMTLVVDAGRITAAASEVDVPDGVPLFDLGQAAVTPGLVNAHTRLGSDVDETTEADASNLRALDVFDPTGAAVRKLRRAGFTAALLAPGGPNVFGGSCAVVRMCPDEGTVVADAGEKIVLAASARRQDRFPASLAGQIELLEAYLAGSPPQTNLFLSDALRAQILAQRQSQLERLRTGMRPAFFAASGPAEVAAALRLIERFELRGVLVAPEDIEPVVPELLRLNVAVVARPWTSGDYDRYLDGLVAAARAGVPMAFGLGSAEEIRLTAAMAVNRGMPRAAALRALCADAARVVGADAEVGIAAAGRRADLVVWTGSPIDLRAKVARVIMAGKSQQKGSAYAVR